MWKNIEDEQPKEHGFYKVQASDGFEHLSYWVTNRLDHDYDYFDLYDNYGLMAEMWFDESYYANINLSKKHNEN